MATVSELPLSQSSPNHPCQTLEQLTHQVISPTLASSPQSCKGKTKIEDIESTSCGICLYEQGRTVRGCIDSCDHFFCFVCIMEWSKVESRCPMCKCRFSSIRRSPMDGVFLSDRIFSVPIRDQVYNNLDDSTMESRNRYSEVKCSVCQGTQAENLILLCDLCDSAAHSFCVGLGPTVPDGTWFCHECTILKDEHARNESTLERNASIFEIVHDPDLDPFTITLPILKKEPKKEREVSLTKRDTVTLPSESSSEKLKTCHNATSRITALRQNWNALQTGSMSFTCNSVNRKNTSNQESTAVRDRRKKDIEKAWKTLNAAKSISKGIVCSVSKQYAREIYNVAKDANVSTKLIASNSKKRLSEDHMLCRLEKKNEAIQVDHSRENIRDPPKENLIGEASNNFCGQPKKCKTEKGCGDNNAKSEIQSLVKLNLKLLTREKKLEVDLFKEVARLSTHLILAACGLQSPKRGVRSFNSSVCCHVNEGQQFRKSTLMPSSCRECFFRFVKDVVNTIMIEKLG